MNATSGENSDARTWVEQRTASLDGGQIESFMSFLVEDVRMQIGGGDVLRGKAEVRAMVEAFLGGIEGMEHRIVDVWRQGEVTIFEMAITYTRLDGTALTVPCVNVWRTRDGLIYDYQGFQDVSRLFA